MQSSLLGYLVSRFSNGAENLATESLVYILNNSEVAKTTFINILSHYDIKFPLEVRFETQSFDENDPAIPDIVAWDMNNKLALLGEVKFWAGLTNNQPVTYLKRLEENSGQVLLFIAPSRRFSTLWPELIYRCNQSGYPVAESTTDLSEIKILQVSKNQKLMLISWRVVLNSLRNSLQQEGYTAILSDLVQLEGLCDRMETEAFIPLRSEELTSDVSKRIIQYCDLVDEIVDELAAKQVISLKGLRPSSKKAIYIRYMRIPNHGLSLEFNSYLWHKLHSTPLWLGVFSDKWQYSKSAKTILSHLERENPPRLFQDAKTLYVPLHLKIGVEKELVFRDVIEQTMKVINLLQESETLK